MEVVNQATQGVSVFSLSLYFIKLLFIFVAQKTDCYSGINTKETKTMMTFLSYSTKTFISIITSFKIDHQNP